MALDYTTTNTGVFYRLGRVVKRANALLAVAAGRDAELLLIADPYEAADLTAQIDGLYSAYTGLKDQDAANAQAVAAYGDNTLIDRATVLDQIGVTSPDLNAVLAELINRFVLDSKTVLRNVVALGSVTAGSGNVGDGTVLVTKIMDGVTSPAAGVQPHLRYAGVNCELAPNETHHFICDRDSDRDGATEGGESFSWHGGVFTSGLDWNTEGSGDGPGLTVSNDQSLITNGDFEDFTGDTPDGWTVTLGTAGTHVFEDGTTYYRGTSGLKLTGDGALAAVELTQSLAGIVSARRMYCLHFRLKASASVSAGDFAARWRGTGYTAGATEEVTIAHGSLPTSWTLYSAFILAPASLPSDLELVLLWNGTPTNAKNVYVDSLALVEVPYFGGIGAVVVAGATPFVAGDRFTCAVTNTNAGVWQTYFRKVYRVQLPSATSSPAIAEALAT